MPMPTVAGPTCLESPVSQVDTLNDPFLSMKLSFAHLIILTKNFIRP